MKINEVKIKSFRGIGNEAINVKLADSNLVLIYAPNGFGKTSIIDGIEWGLTGNISHLEEIKNVDKQRFKKCQMINFFSKDNGNSNSAIVELSFSNGEKLIRKNKLTETGDFDKGSVENIDILESLVAKKEDGISFIDNFYHTHMLGQDTINSFLCSEKSGTREGKLLKIIGIETFDKITESIARDGASLQTLKNNIKKYELDIDKLKGEINGNDENNCLNEGNFTTFQEVREYIELLEDNLLKNKKIVKEVNLNIYNKLFNKKNSVSKNYEYILELFRENEAEVEKLNKDNDNKNRTLKNREKIRVVDESYNNSKNLISLSYIQDNLEDLEQNIKIENKIRRYTKFKKIINDYKLAFNEEKAIVNIHINMLKYIKELEKLELDDINSLKTEVLYFNKELKLDMQEIKLLIGNYEESYKVFQRISNDIKNLEKNIQDLGQAELELKDFYRVNVKYIEERIHEIDENKKCPLCNNEATSQKLLENLKNILKINEDTYKNLKSSKDNLENERKEINEILNQKKLEINYILDEWIESINSKTYIKNVRIINVEAKLKEKHKIILAKRVAEKKRVQAFETHINRVNNFLKLKIDKNKINKMELLQYSMNIKERLNHLYKKLRILEVVPEDYTLEKILDDPEYLYTLKKNLESYDENKNVEDEKLINEIGEVNRIIESIKSLNTNLNNLIKKISVESVKKLEKYESIKLGIEKLEKENNQLKNKLKIIDEIKEKAEEYREKVIREYILENKLVHQIYKNINPHPVHKDIKINNSDGLIFNLNDEYQRVQADYIFSSAQKNVLALSVFLGFALQQSWSRLEQIFIDDPIQNMDDINVVGFVDILRSLFNKESKLNNKTIILTTHDEKFRNLVKMKFRNLKIREYCIESYDFNGPIIKETQNW